MKNTIIKHKFLIVFLISFMLLLFFNFNNVKAFNGIDVSGNEFNCPDIPNGVDYSKGFIFKLNLNSSRNGLHLFIYEDDDTYVYYNKSDNRVSFYGSISIYRLVDDNFVFEEKKTTKSLNLSGYNHIGVVSEFTYFSEGLYNSSDKSEGFFIAPPPVAITPITQVEELPKIIMTILKTIIPVGLVVLSIGLLILLIKSLISKMI